MMTSFYNLLKYAATGIASPDMTYFDRIRASTLMGGVAQTLTGQPPLSFKSDGTAIISWSMKGNGSQSDTPTPDNPVMPEMCGVRTGNLFDRTTAVSGLIKNYGGDINPNENYITSDFILVPAGIYSLSMANGYTGSGTTTNRVCTFDLQKNYVNNVIDATGNRPSNPEYTFTLPSECYIRISVRITDANVMLNTGSTALPYEPYGWKIPLTCAGQTTPVYLGEVETVRKIKKYEITGNENVTAYTGYGAENCFFVTASGLASGVGMCNFYKKAGGLSAWINTDNSFMIADNTARIHDSRFEEAEEFKSWLAEQYAAGTPVTVWYVLANEQTGIVNEPLCKIGDYADELNSEDAGVTIPTIKGSNTLTVDTDLQPSEMAITFKG